MATATRTTVNSQRRDIISPLNDAVNRRQGKKPALPPIDEEDGYRTPDNPDFNPDYDPDNDPDNDPDPNPNRMAPSGSAPTPASPATPTPP